MTCDEAHLLLHAYIDDELDIATSLQIEKHLPDCAECTKELEAAQIVRRTVAQSALYYPLPSELRDRLKRAIRSEVGAMETPLSAVFAARWWNKPMAYSGLAAALLLIIGTVVLFAPPGASRGQIDELVASHVRSLEADHLLDVASTDQHTVKPWFDGKLEFAPPVIDLAPAGFPLIGGRLDYLQEGKIAALVYGRTSSSGPGAHRRKRK